MPTGCNAGRRCMTSPRITKNAQDTSDALPPDSAIRRFDVPATIFHGDECRRELGAIVRGLGGTRVLLVTDPGVVQLGAAGKIVELLTAARPRVARFDAEIDKTAADALASGSPANNPRIPTKEEIVGLYREAW